MLRSQVKSFVLYTNLFDHLRVGHWVQDSRAGEKPRFPERCALYHYVAESTFPGEPIDHLEFGVYEGASMWEWTALNWHEGSRFFGFDGFHGLPKVWKHRRGTIPRGAFDVGGKIPGIPDPRVSFVKGLFQETLPGFLANFRPSGRLVIHLDADLYSSTVYVLSHLHEYMIPGTIVFFDGFITEEFCAWGDYARRHMRKYSVIATSGHFHDQVCLAVGT